MIQAREVQYSWKGLRLGPSGNCCGSHYMYWWKRLQICNCAFNHNKIKERYDGTQNLYKLNVLFKIVKSRCYSAKAGSLLFRLWSKAFFVVSYLLIDATVWRLKTVVIVLCLQESRPISAGQLPYLCCRSIEYWFVVSYKEISVLFLWLPALISIGFL